VCVYVPRPSPECLSATLAAEDFTSVVRLQLHQQHLCLLPLKLFHLEVVVGISLFVPPGCESDDSVRQAARCWAVALWPRLSMTTPSRVVTLRDYRGLNCHLPHRQH